MASDPVRKIGKPRKWHFTICNVTLMTQEYVDYVWCVLNGRSNLDVLAGMMNPWGLLDYLRFCKLCKSHSKVSLSTFFIVFFFFFFFFFSRRLYFPDGDDVNAHSILYPASKTRCPPLMLGLLRLVTKYFITISGWLEYKTFIRGGMSPDPLIRGPFFLLLLLCYQKMVIIFFPGSAPACRI